MKRGLLEVLACPLCQGPLELRSFEGEEEVKAGLLRSSCGQWFPIIEHVPRLLLGPLRGDYAGFLARFAPGLRDPEAAPGASSQVQESYSFKWTRMPAFGFDRPELGRFYDDWFRRKLGFSDDEAWQAYLRGKRLVLDAGTGLGAKVETVARINPQARVIGVDLSESVRPAFANTRHRPNADIVQADLHRLPFREGIFDLIISDGVLHHTPDTAKAFQALIPYLGGGGDIAIHVYKKLGPVRELCDDLLRAHATKLPGEACWEFAVPFTRFGKALAELKVEIEVPEDLPVLGIKAGRYDLQRFIYYQFFKAFWNPDFTFEENTLVNFDWYHPRYAHRHTEQEVLSWFQEAGLVEVRLSPANESGVSVRGRKP